MRVPLNGLTEAWNGSGGVGDRRMGLELTSKGRGGSTTGGWGGGTEAEKGH